MRLCVAVGSERHPLSAIFLGLGVRGMRLSLDKQIGAGPLGEGCAHLLLLKRGKGKGKRRADMTDWSLARPYWS